MAGRGGVRVVSVAAVAAVTLLLSAAAAGEDGAVVTSTGAQPNIVFVITDDEPALDGRITQFLPNIRTLREGGVTFTDFHTETPLCCPGRAGYLTGQHTHNHGVRRNNGQVFRPEMTVATQLQAVGYYNGFFGKYFNLWALKGRPPQPPGWDSFSAFGLPPGEGGAYYDYTLYNDSDPEGEVHGSDPADYSTDVLAEKAVEFLRAAPAERPVFLWIAPFAPHSRSTPAPRHADSTVCDPLGETLAWKPPNFNEEDVSDKSSWLQATPPITTSLARNGASMKRQCLALLAVDDLVGRVRDELAAVGRLENTLFLYGADNGVHRGEHRVTGKSRPYVTEVPFFASWPAVLGPTPRIIQERLENIDLAPTLCELAGCSLGPYPNGQPSPDGRSFAAILRGEATALDRDAVLEQQWIDPDVGREFPAWHAIATTGASPLAWQGCLLASAGLCRWHYIEYETGERELYDISNGPCSIWTIGAIGDPCRLENRSGDPTLAGIETALVARLAALEVEGAPAAPPPTMGG